MQPKQINVGPITVGPGAPLVFVAGPCVVEDESTMRAAARALSEICGAAGLPLIFKSSFEKDNRTLAAAHRGPGLEQGLALLAELGREFGLTLTSDVHRPEQAAPAARVLDLLQIPAFLCRQSSLIEAAGATGRPLNIKKGQFLAPAALAGSRDKALGAGAAGVLLTERGSSFGPDNLVCDLTAVAAMQALGCPVVMDAGHGANRREQIPLLARAGVAAGADALFVECHPHPERARCDGGRMLSLVEMERLVAQVAPLAELLRQG